jgi:ribosomal protein L4
LLTNEFMDDLTRAQNALKKQQAEKKHTVFVKLLRKQSLQVAVKELYNAKIAYGGRLLPYGKMEAVLLGLKEGRLIVSRDFLHNRLRGYTPTVEVEVTRLPLQTITVNTENTSVSSLSGAWGAEDGEANKRKKGGRPKGTTVEYLWKQELNKKECTNDIAQTYQAALDNKLQSESK